ncbi:MAG TPA: FxLYD domain-containing protein [Thermoanaerobaculia bacterium]|nr:FxLYD domain-containing protein [Thermoanaerobaculia bacterium]
MKPQPFAKIALALAAILAAGPAGADWLVTREGARVETQGAWKVKGKLVVFHTAAGKLSSLRVAEVDLDASRRATEDAVAAQAQAAAEPDKPAERRKPVRVITDKDFPPAAPAPDEQPEGEAEDGEKAAPASGPASGPGLVVETWNQARHPEQDHVLINGTLQNASSDMAADVKLKVRIFNEDGALIATSQAALTAGALPPGEKATFKAEFPGFFSFATIKFEGESRRLATQATADQPPPENGN